MSPSRIFILRPVATTLLMLGITLVGMVAYRELPVSALPEAVNGQKQCIPCWGNREISHTIIVQIRYRIRYLGCT